ncbi:MAG: hypothetical protein R6X13_03250 [bacterium]
MERESVQGTPAGSIPPGRSLHIMLNRVNPEVSRVTGAQLRVLTQLTPDAGPIDARAYLSLQIHFPTLRIGL